jgi:hypothetical protein
MRWETKLRESCIQSVGHRCTRQHPPISRPNVSKADTGPSSSSIKEQLDEPLDGREGEFTGSE